jgi:3-carboxy-cis,cis-muconate cycloisomerase
MPHKRNPVGAAVTLAAAIRAPGLVATFLAAMPQEHERGLGGWPAEWETLPELVLLAAGAARAMADGVDGLVVDPSRMRANLDLTHGLVMTEAISMALALPMGKEQAHRAVEAASQRALATRRLLADVLAEDPTITRHLSPSDLAARLTPESYLGAAAEFVRQALARHRGRGSKRA